jgi:mono/diheme cytochrome c family protein
VSALRLAAAGLLFAAALPAAAQNTARGRLVYETQCGGCHYERVHERDRSRSQVKTLAELRAEVVRWAAQVKRPFSAEDLDDLTAYLDATHYHFSR